MPQQLCYTSPAVATACLKPGYDTMVIGGLVAYCAVVPDCDTAYSCLAAQSGALTTKGAMTCTYVSDPIVLVPARSNGTNVATGAGFAASSGSSAATALILGSNAITPRMPNSAGVTDSSPVTVAAVVAAVLAATNSVY